MNWHPRLQRLWCDGVYKYYESSGWDLTNGWPTRVRLEELGIGDIADELE